MAGVTRPTANRALKELEAAGTISVARGRVEILDHTALRQRVRP